MVPSDNTAEVACCTSGSGPINDGARQMLMPKSPVAGKYEKTIDSDSAHEMLEGRALAGAQAAAAAQKAPVTDDSKVTGPSAPTSKTPRQAG